MCVWGKKKYYECITHIKNKLNEKKKLVNHSFSDFPRKENNKSFLMKAQRMEDHRFHGGPFEFYLDIFGWFVHLFLR